MTIAIIIAYVLLINISYLLFANIISLRKDVKDLYSKLDTDNDDSK